ncbi:MAG: hypothetical protein AAF483_01920 [Planctomycetota bacterium]
MENEDTRERALQFLESMESRHNDVLDALDKLNERIEGVLAECLGEKEGGEPPEKPRRRSKKAKVEDNAVQKEVESEVAPPAEAA